MSRSIRNALNKIVRSDLAGGSETLDAVELFGQIIKRHHPHTEAGRIAALAYQHLNAIADAMRDEANLIRKEDKADEQAS